MIKTEGLLKSQMEIVDDHLNRAVSANYNDFLTGIKLIQEIDLDLSRSDIFVQNTRRMLEASKKQITIISFVMNVLYVSFTVPWIIDSSSETS